MSLSIDPDHSNNKTAFYLRNKINKRKNSLDSSGRLRNFKKAQHLAIDLQKLTLSWSHGYTNKWL